MRRLFSPSRNSRNSRKGQYKIVSEVLMFGIGIGIAVLVVGVFQNVSKTVFDVGIDDQLYEVATLVSSSIIKVMESSTDATLSLRVPPKLSDKEYMIAVETNASTNSYQVVVFMEKNPEMRIVQKLFNIGQDNNIIITGAVLSSSEYIIVNQTVVGGKKTIKLQRFVASAHGA